MKFKNYDHIKIQNKQLPDMNNIPGHIAIIMDGNGRWAEERNLPRTKGHRAGVETIRTIVRECNNIGVKYLTLYAFSTENWNRPQKEVNALMKLLVEYLEKDIEELHSNDIIINSIGDIKGLPNDCQDELKKAYEKTKFNSRLTLNLALNYGGRNEIIRAVKNIYEDIEKGILSKDNIDSKTMSNYLYTANMPDPDLIIRPSGEQRISNFLLWQCAYSEFWYSNVKWPDFKREDLYEAICDYQSRNRRFGSIE